MPSILKKEENPARGFTFIELLVVVATMALLFTVGFASFRSFQDRQRLVSAVRLFKGDLRFTQEQALAGIKPAGCSILIGYKLRYVNATNYEISANCGTGAGTDIIVKTADLNDLAPGISFNSPFSYVFFNILGRGVRSALTITLKDDATPPRTVQITINTGGQID